MDVPRTRRVTHPRFPERLRQAGLRATRPRLLVLELLRDRPGHHSADEIVALLANARTPLPRTSVYNVVGALADRGILTMVVIGPGCARYEYADPTHHHFVCKVCGRIQDVPCDGAASPCLTPATFDGEIQETQITFRGTCAACRGRGASRSPR